MIEKLRAYLSGDPERRVDPGIRWTLTFIALGCYLIDQATKLWAVNFLREGEPIPLLGGLIRLDLVYNSGAAFSMGENITVVFSTAAVLVLAGVLIFVVPKLNTVPEAITVGVLLAGIAGNLTDRLIQAPGPMRGHVVDFISIRYFAVINVADIWITIAAVFIAIQLLWPKARA